MSYAKRLEKRAFDVVTQVNDNFVSRETWVWNIADWRREQCRQSTSKCVKRFLKKVSGFVSKAKRLELSESIANVACHGQIRASAWRLSLMIEKLLPRQEIVMYAWTSIDRHAKDSFWILNCLLVFFIPFLLFCSTLRDPKIKKTTKE